MVGREIRYGVVESVINTLTEKGLDVLALPSHVHAIQDSVRGYEGTQLRVPILTAGTPHDASTHDFAPIKRGFEKVTVTVQRYWCKHCEKPSNADMSEHLVDSPNGMLPVALLEDGESVEMTVVVADGETLKIYWPTAYSLHVHQS